MLDKQKSKNTKYLILSALCFASAFVLLTSLKPLALFVGLFVHWVGVEYGETMQAIVASIIVTSGFIGSGVFVKYVYQKTATL